MTSTKRKAEADIGNKSEKKAKLNESKGGKGGNAVPPSAVPPSAVPPSAVPPSAVPHYSALMELDADIRIAAQIIWRKWEKAGEIRTGRCKSCKRPAPVLYESICRQCMFDQTGKTCAVCRGKNHGRIDECPVVASAVDLVNRFSVSGVKENKNAEPDNFTVVLSTAFAPKDHDDLESFVELQIEIPPETSDAKRTSLIRTEIMNGLLEMFHADALSDMKEDEFFAHILDAKNGVGFNKEDPENAELVTNMARTYETSAMFKGRSTALP